MMSRHRAGFTLIELLVVVVLAAFILGAAVQSLVVQERTHRTTSEIIRGQDALRSALGIMEGELREVTTMGGAPAIGMGDIQVATPDSIVVHVQRILGFVCAVSSSERRIFTWTLNGVDRFSTGDGILVFSDNVPTTASDDQWLVAEVGTAAASSLACPTRPGNPVAHQRVDLGTIDGGAQVTGGYLDGVLPGAPVRGFGRVTYGLYSFNGEWGLGRRGSDGRLDPLVLGLAGQGSGLVFTYIDIDGAPITADPVPVASVAGVRIDARTAPRSGTDAKPIELATNIFFRNN